MRYIISLGMLLALAACSGIDGGNIRDFESLPNLEDASYDISTIRIGDHIDIFVAGDRDSRQTVVVSDDGIVDLEHVRALQVVGRSRAALRTEITKRLEASQIYVNPQVVVNITRRENPPQIAVMGAVNKPGVVRFRANMNLAMALAEAGSPIERVGFARPVLVVRNALTEPTVFKFDIEDAIVNAKPWPRLVPGDVVIAQTSLYADVERAIGIARQASETISRPVDTFTD